jgi:hypothetical protein
VTDFTRFPRQIKRIDRDTMAAQGPAPDRMPEKPKGFVEAALITSQTPSL